MLDLLTPAVLAAVIVLVAAIAIAIAFSPHLARPARRRAAVVFLGIVALWFPAVMMAAGEGVFLAAAINGTPQIGIAILGPPLVFLAALRFVAPVRRFAASIPQDWLIGLQGLRLLGGIFVLVWLAGALPWQFAIPAGFGDMAVGVLALVALGRIRAGAPNRNAWIRRVNIAGLADFALAVTTGMLTSPGAMQLLAHDAPNRMIQELPLVLIPTFVVPLFIIIHIVSIRNLGRDEAEAGAGDPTLA